MPILQDFTRAQNSVNGRDLVGAIIRVQESLPQRRQIRNGAAIVLVLVMAVACTALRAAQAESPQPFKQPGQFTLVKDWTFGRSRSDATVRNREELDHEFYYRYIYDGGKLDGLPTYWSYHRDYPDGDPRSLHVLGDRTLTLKGRIPPGGGLWPRGIESGMLRAKIPVTPGMYIEMRAKLPYGLGAWPAFWLNSGVENADGTFSALGWPPEIDIFEFFNWQGRDRTRVLTGNVQTNGQPEKYGHPHDLWTVFKKGEYNPGIDFSSDFHVFALDWRNDAPVWLLDGKPIKQTYYEWHAPAAHILITDQIGMVLPGVNLLGMTADESQWDYVIDYLRVWQVPTSPLSPTDIAVR